LKKNKLAIAFNNIENTDWVNFIIIK
jgi:hypothetical protein